MDGTGAGARRTDLGIQGDSIVSIGDLSKAKARRIEDVGGFVVAPGFIDIHSHSDLSLLDDGLAHSKIRQGVTTEVVGQDGRSMAPLLPVHLDLFRERYGFVPGWRDFAGYYRALESSGISVNVMSMMGAGSLREAAIGREERAATREELASMQDLFRAAGKEGVSSLSSGLEYLPGSYADSRELAALASVGRLYSTHTRNEDDHVLSAVREAIWISRKSGAALNVSHLKAQGRRNWDTLPGILNLLEEAQDSGLTVSCDRYPFTAYSSRLITLFPKWSRDRGLSGLLRYAQDPTWKHRLKEGVEAKIASIGSWEDVLFSRSSSGRWAPFQGMRLSEIARKLGRPSYPVLLDMMKENGGGSMVVFAMSEENLSILLRWKDCAIASDGAALSVNSGGNPHPRNFGTFPAVLERFVREQKVLTLEEAIRKMTTLPARIVGLKDRGILAPGAKADIVVFDEERIENRSTYRDSLHYPQGIALVLVNGEIVVEYGTHTGKRPGKALRVY